ncbi:acyl-CoA dehydrogenase C-terminal domain-containing protein [Porticoccaceae bacterium]|jgi:alkylation response protein AidB-like acyl-CoA dehydrogenase|nr:acyl-CoA dehydrogenase C-terminal domain-containing protein [Porticoccaceae bacterium]MDB9844149.1 acyl-CoA dehydrogenase C-terminal domain-containing protein [Porticoccaceae bacterium]MDC0133792.1 acyl-CoA dehydrogenase C-terminal domain-containing protein [Porticoccaceae bacterium]MDC1476496.1 acyl-CoA dehydrogenase C-terminal domain-containing protein [Porticoccaceae bacterium]CAI8306152.1 MAG: 3-methylmercaptopropionyl-CoA dehydrogenase [SAR92 bacterium MED-G29]|tara:strand:+ start:1185 stop:2996 length:1812 start_codon:yes stop_codon:yes gene_type:complete
MPDFKVPLKDYSFLFNDVIDMQANYKNVKGGDQATPDMLDAIFSEAAKFSETELAPIYQSGDKGCTWDDGVVTTPAGFKEAYAKFIEAGWTSLTGSQEMGGQGLPSSIGVAINEMLTTANWAWAMYPGLSEGAVATLEDHGTPEQKQAYLTKLISGVWSGTMCLTEPHCGTDLGQLKTKAEPNADGSYKVNGTKIFISAGEHDLTENIVHIVLAKLPDAPKGTRGISLFIIPKFLPSADGSAGERNGVRCASIEHKMGIHGNGTAMLNFDDATGFLIGEPHNGLNAMFTYMNVARIGTASQGAAAAERSFQGASKYARERLAMRSLSGVKNPEGPADPIICHPDVRRMLLTQRAIAEGGRAMVTYASQFADLYMGGATEEVRAEAEARLGFCTPILKGFITEQGVIAANHGVQVFGGHGYIQEWGMEQILRDSRIGTLYEGTTGIQALDLIGRKVLMDRFKQLKIFTGEMLSFAFKSLPWPRGNKVQRKQAWTVTKLALKWRYLGYKLAMQGKRNPDAVGAGSVDFLMYSGYAYMAFMWAKMSSVAQAQLDAGKGDTKFLQEKLHTAEFFFERMLPQADVHAKTIGASVESVMAMPEDYFDAS